MYCITIQLNTNQIRYLTLILTLDVKIALNMTFTIKQHACREEYALNFNERFV